MQKLYKDVSGYLSTPSDEGNYAYKVGTGQYAAAIAKGIFDSVAALAGEVTTQYILRYVPNVSGRTPARTLREICASIVDLAQREDTPPAGILLPASP